MRIIPVIDLKNGIVVHARQGNREHYAPLLSKICKTADIFAVIDAYIRLFGFDTIYIADLNALTHQGDHASLLTQALQHFPKINFWIDAGYPILHDDLTNLTNYLPVFGSESFTENTIRELSSFKKNFVLSLDYNVDGEIGAKNLFSASEYWPENIIIMSLPKVGSNLGPDIEKLTRYRTRFPEHNFIAAGGIRNTKDLQNLADMGVNQCLIASALHNGGISTQELEGYRQKNTPASGAF